MAKTPPRILAYSQAEKILRQRHQQEFDEILIDLTGKPRTRIKDARGRTVRLDVIDALRDTTQAMTIEEIANHLGRPYNSVAYALRLLTANQTVLKRIDAARHCSPHVYSLMTSSSSLSDALS